jgi:hypothetical protein
MVWLACDSRLSSDGRRANDYFAADLKLIILRADLVVGGAGLASDVDQAIRRASEMAADLASLDDIADHLARVARHTRGQTEFLLAQRDPARLHRIRESGLEGDSANYWIGDPVAFEEYQRIRLGTPTPEFGDHGMDPLDLAARLVGDPLREMIRAGSIRTVGELTIRVLSEVDGFSYGAEAGMLVSDVQLGPPNQQGERDVLARASA